jgi:hypothetical protein
VVPSAALEFTNELDGRTCWPAREKHSMPPVPRAAKAPASKLENVMGRFDSRNSQKMSRRKRQRKLKAREARAADAVKATRQKKPTGKKK